MKVFWWVFAGVAWLVLIGGIVVLYPYGNVFFEHDVAENSNLEAIRNIVLTMAALLAFPLALHRMIIADNQLDATKEQIKQAKKEIIEKDFKEMRGDLLFGNKEKKHLFIEQLWKLAQSQPEDYHIKVMGCLSDLLKNEGIITDMNYAVMALKILTNQDDEYKKTEGQKLAEIKSDYRTRLRDIQITDINLGGADFSMSELKNVTFSNIMDFKGALFAFSDLLNTQFDNCFLSDANFSWSMLNKTTFRSLDLTKAHFVRTFLRDTNFSSGIQGEDIVCDNVSMAGNNSFANADYEDMFVRENKMLSEEDWKEDRQSVFNQLRQLQLQKSSS